MFRFPWRQRSVSADKYTDEFVAVFQGLVDQSHASVRVGDELMGLVKGMFAPAFREVFNRAYEAGRYDATVEEAIRRCVQ